jgi:8-oxo-dGTP pyrophosphatase MutT (NUDIX family)
LISLKQFYDIISKNESLKITNEKNIEYFNSSKNYSSVLVIIHFPENIPSVVLTKRSPYLKNHAGEISFPGGKFSITDKTILNTAIRETFEEIGITINKKQVIGCLSPTYTYTSKILIYPFIALEEKISDKQFRQNSEIERIINIPIEKLIKSQSEDEYHSNKNFKMFKFLVDDFIIWGATARILKDLIDKILK